MSTTPDSGKVKGRVDRMKVSPPKAARDHSSDRSANVSNLCDSDSDTDESYNRTPSSVSNKSAQSLDKSNTSQTSLDVADREQDTSRKWSPKLSPPSPKDVRRRSPRQPSSPLRPTTTNESFSSTSYSYSKESVRLTRQALHQVPNAQTRSAPSPNNKYTAIYSSSSRQMSQTAHDSKDRSSITCGTCLLLGCIVAACLGLAVFTGRFTFWCGTSKPMESNSTYETFVRSFEDVRDAFDVQSTHLWRTLKSGTRPVMQPDEPIHPAVFLLVIPRDAELTAACIIRLYADAVINAFKAEPIVKFALEVSDEASPLDVKRKLDDTLRDGFQRGSRLAVIDHLERLHGESSMMLHAYCDNSDAPFRRAVFILALHIDEFTSDIRKTSEEMTKIDEFVTKKLGSLWADTLGSNRFYPLMTRIGNLPAFVYSENSDVLRRNRC